MNGYVYVHCWGGVGRTGTIVACYLSQNWEESDLSHTLEVLRRNFSEMPKSAYRKTPETKEQIDFIEQFINSNKYSGKVLSIRSNGNIFMFVDNNRLMIYTEKASPNHKRM